MKLKIGGETVNKKEFLETIDKVLDHEENDKEICYTMFTDYLLDYVNDKDITNAYNKITHKFILSKMKK